MNPYEILGVDADATQDEIRDAYIRLSKEKHPDKEGGSHDEFVKIKAAYDVLNNPDQKLMFDQMGVMPGTPEYQVVHEAIQSIARAFDQVMIAVKIEDLGARNIVQMIRETIGGTKREGEKSLADVKDALTRCTKAEKILRKQMKRKNKNKPDIFQKFLAERIMQINMTMAAIERALSVVYKAEEILSDYEFMADKGEEQGKIVYTPLQIGLGGLGGILGF